MKPRVLVTAGADGIGRAIALAFAAGGAGGFVCDIDSEGLNRLAKAPHLSTGRPFGPPRAIHRCR